MSLFGFPSGLSGGSKETEYLTEYITTGNTLKSTNYGNTSWATNKSTTRSTGKTVTAWYSGIGKQTYKEGGQYGLGGHYLQMEGSSYFLRFRYASSSQDGYLTGGMSEYSGRNGHTNGNGGVYTSSSGQDPSINVGKYLPYRNNGLKIGAYMGNWKYAIEITSSAPYAEWQRVIDVNRTGYDDIRDAPASVFQFTTSYSGNTSFETYSHNTSRDTFNDTLSPTSFGTDYQTSHITYG